MAKKDKPLTREEQIIDNIYESLKEIESAEEVRIPSKAFIADFLAPKLCTLGYSSPQEVKDKVEEARRWAIGYIVEFFVEVAINLYITDEQNKKFAWDVWAQVEKQALKGGKGLTGDLEKVN